MCRSAWEAPKHSGLQPAALRSLECGSLGRGEAPAWPRWGWSRVAGLGSRTGEKACLPWKQTLGGKVDLLHYHGNRDKEQVLETPAPVLFLQGSRQGGKGFALNVLIGGKGGAGTAWVCGLQLPAPTPVQVANEGIWKMYFSLVSAAMVEAV